MLFRLSALGVGLLACIPVFSQSFTNVAVQQGIQFQYTGQEYGGGLSFYDVDNDGWDDLTLGTSGSGVIFYKNNQGNFAPGVYLLPSNAEVKQILWADYDNDGDADLFVTNFNAPNRLYRNNGNIYNLEDYTIQAGLPLTSALTFGCGFSDYDRDSDLDLYICNYNNSVYTNYFYQNDGDGTFTNITTAAGISDGYCYSFNPLFADFNNDMWSDLFVINDRMECSNSFWLNQQGTFYNQTQESGLTDHFFAMNNSAADYDLDGDLDIYVSNNPTGNRLYNNNNVVFTNVADTAGVLVMDHSWSSVWVDFDHDMDEDLYVSCSPFWSQPGQNRFFINQGDGTFSEGTSTSGFTNDIGSSHAAAVGDYNNDGHFDIFSVNDAPVYSRFFKGNASNNNWLKVTLQGVQSNKDGIGSWIEAYSGGIKQIRFTHCGEGYLSQNSRSEIFGFGQSNAVDSLIVKWPSGHIDRFYGNAANQSLVIIEGMTVASGILASDVVLCENSSIELIAYGGASYVWNTGVENDTLIVTEPGTYFFTGYTSWGNSYTSESVTIVGAPGILAEFQISHESCSEMNDGSISIASANGLEFESVLFNGQVSTGFESSLYPGNYLVTLENELGCITTTEISIFESPPLVLTIASEPIACHGSSTVLEASAVGGNGEYTYHWNTIDPSNVVAGVYEMSVTDQLGCTASTIFVIDQPSEIAVDIETTPLTNDLMGTITMNIAGGTPPFNIITFGPSGYTNNASEQSNLDAGLYTWIVVDANGCSLSGSTEIEDETIDVSELYGTDIKIYPIPTHDVLNITSQCELKKVVVFASDGKILAHHLPNRFQLAIDLSDFPQGIYFLEINDLCGTYSRKFVVD